MEQKEALSKGKSNIFIVDDHPIVRLGLSYLINHSKEYCVCGESESAHDALTALESFEPDLIIIDVSLKGSSGIELIKNIRLRLPKLPILVLSIHDEAIYAEIVLRAGAKGYIMKQEASESILYAIKKVLEGEIYVSESMKTKLLHKFLNSHSASSASPMELLSDRELEVFRLIGQGCGTRQIAAKLNLSIKTIESYRSHLKEKLKLKTASDLVQYSIKWMQSELLF